MITHAEDRAKLVTEAVSWLRTPYHHQALVKGVGVDCAMFPIGVYRNALHRFTEFDPRPYPVEWHLHRDEERYLDHLESCGARKVEVPGDGDIAMFKFGRTVSHGGIVIPRETNSLRFIHSYIGRGVIITDLSEEDYAARLHSFWSVFP